MGENNSSNSVVAIVAIIAILLILIGGYFLFLKSEEPSSKKVLDIEIKVPTSDKE